MSKNDNFAANCGGNNHRTGRRGATLILRSMLTVAALTASAAFTLGAGAPPAQSANMASCARFTTETSVYQQKEVSAALANNPAGRCIAPGEIEWNHSSVIMKIPASPDTYPGSCPTGGNFDTGWACVYNAPNFGGTRLQFHDCCYYQDLQHYGGPYWESLSYISTRRSQVPSVHPFRSWLNQYTTVPHGHAYCMEGESSSSNINDPAVNDRWILLTNNEDHC